jgi:hypothetical protein
MNSLKEILLALALIGSVRTISAGEARADVLVRRPGAVVVTIDPPAGNQQHAAARTICPIGKIPL